MAFGSKPAQAERAEARHTPESGVRSCSRADHACAKRAVSQLPVTWEFEVGRKLEIAASPRGESLLR